MPAPDWLEGLGGALTGINKGATMAADPYKAWDAVVSSGLANEKSALDLRNLAALQQQREAQPDFYGNVIGAQNVGNQLAMSKGERDIFGFNQELLGSKALVSPEAKAQLAGLNPADPEYRAKVAAIRGQYAPELGIAEYDKFGIPALQQRNLNEQAVTAYLTSYAQRADPGAQVIRAQDGTYVIVGSDGKTHALTADQAVKAADMIASKSPMESVERGIKLESLINTSNAALYKAMNDGKITPAARIKTLDSLRIGWGNVYSKAISQMQARAKEDDFKMMSEEQKAATLQPYKDEAAVALGKIKEVFNAQQAVAGGGGLPRIPGAADRSSAGVPGVVATPFSLPPLAAQVAGATGKPPPQYGPQSKWGLDVLQQPPAPVAPQADVPMAFNAFGQSGGPPPNYNLEQYLQELLQQANQ